MVDSGVCVHAVVSVQQSWSQSSQARCKSGGLASGTSTLFTALSLYLCALLMPVCGLCAFYSVVCARVCVWHLIPSSLRCLLVCMWQVGPFYSMCECMGPVSGMCAVVPLCNVVY